MRILCMQSFFFKFSCLVGLCCLEQCNGSSAFFHKYRKYFRLKIFQDKKKSVFHWISTYSEVPNRRADRNKREGLEKKCHPPCLLLSKLINEQGWIFCLLHGKLRTGWKENLKNLSEHALPLGTSEYAGPPLLARPRRPWPCLDFGFQ